MMPAFTLSNTWVFIWKIRWWNTSFDTKTNLKTLAGFEKKRDENNALDRHILETNPKFYFKDFNKLVDIDDKQKRKKKKNTLKNHWIMCYF